MSIVIIPSSTDNQWATSVLQIRWRYFCGIVIHAVSEEKSLRSLQGQNTLSYLQPTNNCANPSPQARTEHTEVEYGCNGTGNPRVWLTWDPFQDISSELLRWHIYPSQMSIYFDPTPRVAGIPLDLGAIVLSAHCWGTHQTLSWNDRWPDSSIVSWVHHLHENMQLPRTGGHELGFLQYPR